MEFDLSFVEIEEIWGIVLVGRMVLFPFVVSIFIA
jgi:hypothetical protein